MEFGYGLGHICRGEALEHGNHIGTHERSIGPMRGHVGHSP
jgi:hypothetical protein